MKLKIEYQPLERLHDYEQNARVHPPSQIEQLCQSIAQFGFLNPVLVRADGTIVAGHGRVMAARKLGLDQVPCIRVEHLTDEQIRAFTLADNKLALNAAWDFEKLSAELNSLVESNFDIGLIGFDASELDNLLAESFSVLPEVQFQQEAIAPVPVNRPAPAPIQYSSPAPVVPETPTPPAEEKPTASGDKYSNFEMLMLHQHKVELVEKLAHVRSVMGFPKLEDALMHIVRAYEEE